MGVSKTISKEAREYVISEIHDNGRISKSEIKELMEPFLSFDIEALKEKERNRVIASIVRTIRDDDGVRSAFIVKGQDEIIDVDTCASLPKVTAVDKMLELNIKGLQSSHHKTTRRKQELSGQMSLLDKRSENAS